MQERRGDADKQRNKQTKKGTKKTVLPSACLLALCGGRKEKEKEMQRRRNLKGREAQTDESMDLVRSIPLFSGYPLLTASSLFIHSFISPPFSCLLSSFLPPTIPNTLPCPALSARRDAPFSLLFSSLSSLSCHANPFCLVLSCGAHLISSVDLFTPPSRLFHFLSQQLAEGCTG